MSEGLGSENTILWADTEPPVAGFGAYGGCTILRRRAELPGILISIYLGLVKAVFIRSWARSCIDPAS